MNKTQQLLKEREEEFMNLDMMRLASIDLTEEELEAFMSRINSFNTTTVSLLFAGLKGEIGDSHNLETKYSGKSCELTEHYPIWDGQYYTCQFCGKEFVKKDDISTLISEIISNIQTK